MRIAGTNAHAREAGRPSARRQRFFSARLAQGCQGGMRCQPSRVKSTAVVLYIPDSVSILGQGPPPSRPLPPPNLASLTPTWASPPSGPAAD